MKSLDPIPLTGLSDTEATARLKREGYNELPNSKRYNFLAIAIEVLSDPFY